MAIKTMSEEDAKLARVAAIRLQEREKRKLQVERIMKELAKKDPS